MYIGVTNNLIRRVFEHKSGKFDGFSKKHNNNQLVWFEDTNSIEAAILKEKQLKKWNREWKIRIIEENNPEWNDLSVNWFEIGD